MYFKLPEEFKQIKKIKEVNLLSLLKKVLTSEISNDSATDLDDIRKSYEDEGWINFTDPTHPFHVTKHHWEYFFFYLPESFDYTEYEEDDSELRKLFHIPSGSGQTVNGYHRERFLGLIPDVLYLGICLTNDNQMLYTNPDEAIFYIPFNDRAVKKDCLTTLIKRVGLYSLLDQPYALDLKDEILGILTQKQIPHQFIERSNEIVFYKRDDKFYHILTGIIPENDDLFPVFVVKNDRIQATRAGYDESSTTLYNASKRLETLFRIDDNTFVSKLKLTFNPVQEGIGESRTLNEEHGSDYVEPMSDSVSYAEYLNDKVKEEESS